MKNDLPACLAVLYLIATVFSGTAIAATAVVPTDYAAIQDAVNAVQNDLDPGEVIINSNATFNEWIVVNESVTLRAGIGFAPVIASPVNHLPPIRVRALQNHDTAVLFQGIETMTDTGGPSEAISVSNDSAANVLNVEIDSVTVDVTDGQSGISVASASINADINITIRNSLIRIEGEGSGNPNCIRFDPFAYSINAFLFNNTFQYSGAGGISIEGGRDDKLMYAYIDANVFEGFASAAGEGRTGVSIHGTGTSGSDASPTLTYMTNNLFLNTARAMVANGQQAHTHTVIFNNNTVIGSTSDGIRFDAYSTSMISAYVANNIIFGSAHYGIYRQDPPVGTINLTNNFNLLFDNTDGDFLGATAGSDSLLIDPMFTDSSAGDYHLQPSSPAIDSGTNFPPGGIGWLLEDLDGNARVQDSDGDGTATCNIGAYEVPADTPFSPSVSPSAGGGGGGGGGGCFIGTLAD